MLILRDIRWGYVTDTSPAPFTRRSMTPSTSFYVASDPSSGSGTSTRKRDSVPGFFNANDGVLQYTTDQDEAAALFWVDDYYIVLGWVATENVPALNLVQGTAHSLFAIPNGQELPFDDI